MAEIVVKKEEISSNYVKTNYINKLKTEIKDWSNIFKHTIEWYTFIPWLVRNIKKERTFAPNSAMLKRTIKNKEFLKAYETFWGTYNKAVTADLTSKVYNKCGGNSKPVLASLGSFFYSGLMIHAINPIMLLGNTINLINNESLEFSPEVIYGYLALGVPVMLSKLRDKIKTNKKIKNKLSNLENKSIDDALEHFHIKLPEDSKKYNKFKELYDSYVSNNKSKKLVSFISKENPSFYMATQLSYYKTK